LQLITDHLLHHQELWHVACLKKTEMTAVKTRLEIEQIGGFGSTFQERDQGRYKERDRPQLFDSLKM